MLTVLHAIKHDNLKFKNTLVFGFVSGHFQIPQSGIEGRQATSRFLRDLSMYETSQHLEMKKALGLTVEHLGGLDYVDSQKENKLIATGLYDPLYVYASTKENRDLVLKSLSGTNASGRYQILKPRKMPILERANPCTKTDGQQFHSLACRLHFARWHLQQLNQILRVCLTKRS